MNTVQSCIKPIQP